MKWFRVYSEVKDDPKMLELDFEQRWLWLSLLAMASESDDRGVITFARTRGLAAALRTTEDTLLSTLELLTELKMLEQGDGNITITHWNERQYDKPSDAPERVTERARKYRETKRNAPLNEGNADVTPMKRDVTPMKRDVTPMKRDETPQIQIQIQRQITETEGDEEEEHVPRSDAAAATVAHAASDPRLSEIPASVHEVSDILIATSFVNDDRDDVASAVQRAYALVPDFDTRDGPFEAAQFAAWFTSGKGKRKQPTDWTAAFRNWLKNAVKHERRDASAPTPINRNGRIREPDFSGIDAFSAELARQGVT